MKDKLKENLQKSDIDKQIKVYLNTKEFKDRIEKIVKDRVKNEKEIEDKIVDITSNVLTQLYKTLWNKRAIWKNNLSNKSN